MTSPTYAKRYPTLRYTTSPDQTILPNTLTRQDENATVQDATKQMQNTFWQFVANLISRRKRTTMQHTYDVIIEGTAPLIQNNPQAALDKKDGLVNSEKISKSQQDPTEQWRTCVYRSKDGKRLQHPSEALEMALAEAAANFKAKGKGSMKKPLKASVFLDGEWMELINKTEPDEVKRMQPRNSLGQIVPFYAPVFAPGWRLRFRLDLLDDEIVTPGHLKSILDFAGARIGIGVHRPKYGRFMVVKFDEVKTSSKRAA